MWVVGAEEIGRRRKRQASGCAMWDFWSPAGYGVYCECITWCQVCWKHVTDGSVESYYFSHICPISRFSSAPALSRSQNCRTARTTNSSLHKKNAFFSPLSLYSPSNAVCVCACLWKRDTERERERSYATPLWGRDRNYMWEYFISLYMLPLTHPISDIKTEPR